MRIVKRLFALDLPKGRSAFLWGPRKVGKTYWIAHELRDAAVIDLLKTDVFADYAVRPALLRERFQSHKGLIVIDKEEIAAETLTQNIPAFSEFLRVAAITSSELLNYANVAREAGVSAKSESLSSTTS
jgi:predicted AAA+ superfamily ATPase